MANEELVYSIDLDWDKLGFGDFSKSFDVVMKNFKKVTALATAASTAMFGIAKTSANYGDELLHTADLLGTTTQELEKLRFAAEINDASYQDLTSSLESLNKAQFDVLRGKGDFEAWGRIGVNPAEFENTSDLLLAISDGMQEVSSRSERINIAERLGISKDLLPLLESGRASIGALTKEAEALGAVSSKSFLESADKFNDAWTRAQTVTRGIFNEIGANLLNDTIMPAIEAFTNFAKNNMKQIVSTIKSIMNVIADVSKVIFSLIQRAMIQFERLSNALGGTENAVKALAAVFLILKAKTLAAMAPALLMIGLLWVAFDEFMSFLEGKESFLGDFLGIFGIANNDVADLIKNIDLSTVGIIAMGVAVLGLGRSLKAVKTILFAIGKSPIGRAILLTTAAIEGVQYLADKTADLLAPDDKFSFIKDDAMKKTLEAAASGNVSKETAAAGAAWGSDESPTNVNITVNAANADAKEVGEIVKKKFDEITNQSASRGGF